MRFKSTFILTSITKIYQKMNKNTTDAVQNLRMEVQYSMLKQVIKECFKEAVQEFVKKLESNRKSESPLLTIGEIATRFKVTKTTIHNWRVRGLIVGRKLGKNRYYTEAEVSEALEKHGWGDRLSSGE